MGHMKNSNEGRGPATLLSAAERARLRQALKVGDRVRARIGIDYPDREVHVDAGWEGVVVAPELVQPIVRVVWDHEPDQSLTTYVNRLDWAPPLRERERAKRAGEPTCAICGCSERDACPGGCAWADTGRSVCTGCLP